MVAVPCVSTVPVPPPAYHRAQAKAGPALHLDALTLVTRLHLLAGLAAYCHQPKKPSLRLDLRPLIAA